MFIELNVCLLVFFFFKNSSLKREFIKVKRNFPGEKLVCLFLFHEKQGLIVKFPYGEV